CELGVGEPSAPHVRRFPGGLLTPSWHFRQGQGDPQRPASGTRRPSQTRCVMAWRRWLRALVGAGRPGRRAWPVRLRLEALEERCVPSAWVTQTQGQAQNLFGVWGSGPNDIFAVGVNELGKP